MQLILFEDEHVSRLAPITWSRPAFAIGCGGTNLLELLSEWQVPIATHVRPHLSSVWHSQSVTAFGDLTWHRASESLVARQVGVVTPHDRVADPAVKVNTRDCTVWLNARLVPSRQRLQQLRSLLATTTSGAVWQGDVLVCVVESGVAAGPRDIDALRARSAAPAARQLEWECPLMDFAHDVIRHHEACLQENLEYLVNHGQYHEIADDVFAATGVTLGQFVISDTTNGPIVLEQECTVEPYSYLCGPLRVGRLAKVRARAQLRGGVSVGLASRIGGEVQSCVIEAYSNKQHDGFLGHSYLGSWVNLGAGTCVSNLKNTYGEISVNLGGQKKLTGMKFLGAILGDYVKTAIQTSIFSGKLIGPASMIYGTVTENVGSFVNYAKQLGDVTEVAVDALLSGQARMMQRRGMEMTEGHRQLLCDLFELTRHERTGLESRPPRI